MVKKCFPSRCLAVRLPYSTKVRRALWSAIMPCVRNAVLVPVAAEPATGRTWGASGWCWKRTCCYCGGDYYTEGNSCQV